MRPGGAVFASLMKHQTFGGSLRSILSVGHVCVVGAVTLGACLLLLEVFSFWGIGRGVLVLFRFGDAVVAQSNEPLDACWISARRAISGSYVHL